MKGVCPECGSGNILFHTVEEVPNKVLEVDEEGNPVSYGDALRSDVIDDLGYICLDCNADFDHAKAVENAD